MAFHENVLHHIADVDAPLDALIHAQLYHSMQGLAMPSQEAFYRLPITLLGVLQQFSGVLGIWPDGICHNS